MKIKYDIELNRQDLIELLELAGYKIPDGDYSNVLIYIDTGGGGRGFGNSIIQFEYRRD